MLSRKKTGFGIVGLVIVATLYYFTIGSAQITEKIKTQVNNELTTLQQNGFKVKERKIKEREEHFVIDFDDPTKITRYLNSQGAEVTQEDILLFKGLKIAVDAKYLYDSYSALSLDIYPISLPESLLQSTDKEDKEAIAYIQKMMADKKLLVHLDFNKLLSGFKGYIKDIHETFEDKEKITFVSQGFKFEGDIENKKVKTVRQTLKLLSLGAGNELSMKLSNFKSNYTLTGLSPYDFKSTYSVEKIKIQGEEEFSMFMKNLNVTAISSVKNNLLKSSITTKADETKLIEKQKSYTMDDIFFDYKIDNLDIASFEALKGLDINDEKAINALSQKIVSKGITMKIPHFSIKKISDNGKSMDGFELSASLAIDKSFDINAASQNPLAILDAISSKTDISVSSELFSLIAQEPKAMMILMLMPPVEKDNNKIYEIEFIKGKLTVNGKSIM